MSRIGLNSNIYKITGEYLNLINSFIVEAKVNPQKVDVKKRKNIVDLFTKMSDFKNTGPKIQLVSSIIESDLWEKRKVFLASDYYSMIISELSEPLPSASTIKKLQSIAEALDSEHSGALAKIKGEL